MPTQPDAPATGRTAVYPFRPGEHDSDLLSSARVRLTAALRNVARGNVDHEELQLLLDEANELLKIHCDQGRASRSDRDPSWRTLLDHVTHVSECASSLDLESALEARVRQTRSLVSLLVSNNQFESLNSGDLASCLGAIEHSLDQSERIIRALSESKISPVAG